MENEVLSEAGAVDDPTKDCALSRRPSRSGNNPLANHPGVQINPYDHIYSRGLVKIGVREEYIAETLFERFRKRLSWSTKCEAIIHPKSTFNPRLGIKSRFQRQWANGFVCKCKCRQLVFCYKLSRDSTYGRTGVK